MVVCCNRSSSLPKQLACFSRRAICASLEMFGMSVLVGNNVAVTQLSKNTSRLEWLQAFFFEVSYEIPGDLGLLLLILRVCVSVCCQ